MASEQPKFKNGQTVSFIRRNGVKATGRVCGTDHSVGTWIAVNTAEKGKNPQITKLRPSQLTKVD